MSIKNLIWAAVILIIGIASWQGLSSFMKSHEIRQLMQDTLDEARNHDAFQMKENLIQRAERAGIPLSMDQIEISVSTDEKGGAVGFLTKKHGIQTLNKKVFITVIQEYQILKIKRKRFLTMEQNYTVKATMPENNRYQEF